MTSSPFQCKTTTSDHDIRSWSRPRCTGRLRAIIENCDLQDATVVDLGCNAGYFTFPLAERASDVVAVDGDPQLIEQNRIRARKKALRNITFIHALITPEFIRSDTIPFADVTLFLSVLHHIIAQTGGYDFNVNNGQAFDLNKGIEILRAIRRKTSMLCFEMGEPADKYKWAALLPEMGRRPHKWIIHHLLTPAGFDDIQAIRAPQWRGPLRPLFRLIRSLEPHIRIPARIVRTLGYDGRDGRTLFIAR